MPVEGLKRSPKVALVLGSGAARGWAHLGVIEGLREMGITPDLITGCSIGAVVGGFYATGKFQELLDFASELTLLKMVDYLDLTFSGGGVMSGSRLMTWIEEHLGDQQIEDLNIPFATVAVDIRTGREVWLRDGPVADAIRASIALPGLLTPFQHEARWLSDGGLVNPVPVSLARAMEADVVIAVDLNGGVFRHDGVPGLSHMPGDWMDDVAENPPQGIAAATLKRIQALFESDGRPQQYEVLNNAVAIMSDRITKARLAGEPADVLLVPAVGEIGAMQFHKGEEGIEAGREVVRLMRPAIVDAVGLSNAPVKAGRDRQSVAVAKSKTRRGKQKK